MLFNFLPKNFNFFDLFDKQADFAVEAAKVFKEITANGPLKESVYQKVQHLEHQADEVAHSIIEHLNKTFITPFDREDIHALAKEIDNIVDMINAIVNRLKVYKLEGGNKHLIEFASVIEESVGMVSQVVKGMRNTKNMDSILKSCVEINRLENVGDSLRDVVLGQLFETTKDPITLIKWKEVYEHAEIVLDICEDVAHVVESILVKQA